MLEEVKPLYGFRRDKNKYFISKIVEEIKTDIFVLRNTYNNYWENTDIETYLSELSTYEEIKGEAIVLGDEIYTSQIVNYMEEMKCKRLLNLKGDSGGNEVSILGGDGTL